MVGGIKYKLIKDNIKETTFKSTKLDLMATVLIQSYKCNSILKIMINHHLPIIIINRIHFNYPYLNKPIILLIIMPQFLIVCLLPLDMPLKIISIINTIDNYNSKTLVAITITLIPL